MTTTTMTLSEAIRLGSTLRPQAFGDLFANGGSCAIGAAYEACGFSETGDLWRFVRRFPIVLVVRSCPVCPREMDVQNIIVHLNDQHRWSRERIADWVATVEAEVAVPQARGDEADAQTRESEPALVVTR